MLMKNRWTFLMAALQTCSMYTYAEAPLSKKAECQVLVRALSAFPSLRGAPDEAFEKDQPCKSQPNASWKCELQVKNSCTGAMTGAKRDSGRVFAEALETAEACFPNAIRKNMEFNENNKQKRRILREAIYKFPDNKLPYLIVSADVIQQLEPKSCEASELSIRFATP